MAAIILPLTLIIVSKWLCIKAQENLTELTHRADWSYIGNTGPSNWCNIANGCCGMAQSPVDLKIQGIQVQPRFNFIGYTTTSGSVTMTNNGHSVAVRFSSDVVPRMSGGGLNGTYFFDSLHLHWGSTDNRGSEHTISGREFPLELHLVHYNSRFVNVQEAVGSRQRDALAVLGIIFLLRNENRGLKPITDELQYVRFNGQTTPVKPFPLRALLPTITTTFYRYPGSLTTPTCDQVVAWTVFTSLNELSPNQIQQFRNLYASDEGQEPPVEMSDNFRPVQPLNGRMVQKILAFL